jgi:hypothetical protein
MRSACQQGNCKAGYESEYDSRIGDRIGQNHVFRVDKDQCDHRCNEDEIERQGPTQTVSPKHSDPQKRG